MTPDNELLTAAALGGLPNEQIAILRNDAANAAAIDEITAFDRSLSELFAPVWAGSSDGNSVRTLRAAWTQTLAFTGWQKKLAYGLAASVGLGLVGMTASMMSVGMPGSGQAARIYRESPGMLVDGLEDLTNTDKGLDSSIPLGTNSDITALESLDQSLRDKFRTTKKDLKESNFFENILKSDDSPPAVSEGRPANQNRQLDMRLKAGVSNGAAQFGEGKSRSLTTNSLPYPPPPPPPSPLPPPASYYRYAASDPQTAGLSDGQTGKDKDVDAKKLYEFSKSAELSFKSSNSTEAERLVQLGRELNRKQDSAGQNHPRKPDQDSAMMDLPVLAKAATSAPLPVTTPTPIISSGQPAPPVAPEVAKKIIIRSGEMEFEVDSFDGSVASISKLVNGIPGGFVATINSEKMANGKVKGSVVVRVPPDKLDGFVLDLRRDLAKGGELKGQRIGSEDITKKYTDLESRLRAARTMETRLLEIIKSGKGEIKQLLECEKELGIWRTKIEEFEGELRYYGNQVSLSTLTITIAEKEIKAAATITESELISAGIEVDDVEVAYRAVQAAVVQAKGRMSKAEMKQHSQSQFTASLLFSVAPEAAGPLQDRLKQIGLIGRLAIQRVQATDGQPVPADTKLKRGDTVFDLQIYNLAAYEPRETASLEVAVPDVAKAAAMMRETVLKANGRVISANISQQDKRNVVALIDFDIKRADEPAVKAALEAAGETVSRNVNRAAEGLVTDSKVKYRVSFTSVEKIAPRESILLGAEVPDVDAAAALVTQSATNSGGKLIDKSSSRDANGRVTAKLLFDVPLNVAMAVSETVRSAGVLRATQTTRDPNAPDGQFAIARIEVKLANEDRIVAADNGVALQVKKGLSYSAGVLLTSVSWVIFGLCVVVPWLIVGYLGVKLTRWLSKGKAA